jgi:FixJ family two-component response regulator
LCPRREDESLPHDPTICVIDDDESVRLSLEGLLRSLGHAVRSFASAEEFLGSPVHARCACVISDVQMPGMSGLDLQEKMRAARLATPFIFVTAFGEGQTRARAMNGGAFCFLRKPFDADALIACLDRALAAEPRLR